MRHAPFTQHVDENVCALRSRLIFLLSLLPAVATKTHWFLWYVGLAWLVIQVNIHGFKYRSISIYIGYTILDLWCSIRYYPYSVGRYSDIDNIDTKNNWPRF